MLKQADFTMIRFTIIIILFSFASKLCGQSNLSDITEKIHWISTSEKDGGRLPVFRKTFEINEVPNYAKLTATALGIYDVEVNGSRVGDQELKPGWTDYRKEVFAQEFDVSRYLRPGINEIRVQLSKGWWAGGISRQTYGRNPLLEFAAIIEIDDNLPMVTDSTWEYAIDGPLLAGDIYDGESYDARLTPRAWTPARVTGMKPVSVYVYNGLEVRVRDKSLWRIPVSITVYKDTIANGTRYGMISPIEILSDTSFKLKKGYKAVVDLGQNMVGWVNFTAKAKKGTLLTLHHGEMLNYNGDHAGRLDDGPGGSVWLHNLRTAKAEIKYYFKGDGHGESWHPRHTFMGFRYVEISASQDVEIFRIEGQPVGSDIEEWGEFECSDENVNKLYSNILWGQRGNFLSVPTDCPQRDERLGWTGDTQIFSKTALYNSNAAEFYRKWMRDMRNSQREDGAFPDIAPYPSFWGYGTAAWGDAGVIVPWNVYEMTGNRKILEENIESMEKWMQWLEDQTETSVSESNPSDRIIYRYCGGGTSTGDWLAYAQLDPRYVSMAYYAYTSNIMTDVCQILGRASRANHYRNLCNEVKREFRMRFLDGDGQLESDSQTAYLLALRLGLLPDSCVQEARNRLRRNIENNNYKLNTGFVGTAFLCPTLSEEGMDDLAYALLLQRENPSWLYSVDQGATTIWERWDSYTIDGGFHKHHWNMNSFNHYAYGVIAEWMYAYMGGIRPALPGFRKILLSPHVDNRPDNHPSLKFQKRINWVKTKTHTPVGDIYSEWHRTSAGNYDFLFIIPKDAEYEVDIPGLTENDTVRIQYR